MTGERDRTSLRAERIAQLNDALRKTGQGGMVVTTAGVVALGESFLKNAISAVRGADDFSEGNDPYDEHDFGVVHVEGQKLFWKIDYFDRSMPFHSADPGDASVTARVLTIMLADEY